MVTYWFGSLDAKVNLVSFHQMYNCKKIVTVCCSGLKSTTSYTVIDWFIYIGGLEGNVLSYGTSIWHNLSPIWFSSHGLTIDWPLQWNIKTKDHNKIYSKNGDDEKADCIRIFQEFVPIMFIILGLTTTKDLLAITKATTKDMGVVCMETTETIIPCTEVWKRHFQLQIPDQR